MRGKPAAQTATILRDITLLREITLPSGCTLSGESWKMMGELLRFIKVATRRGRIEVETLDIHLVADQSEGNPDPYAYHPLGDTPDMNIEQLYSIATFPIGHVSHYLSWTNILITIVIVCVLCVSARLIYMKRDKIKLYLQKKTKKNKQTPKPKRSGQTPKQPVELDKFNVDSGLQLVADEIV